MKKNDLLITIIAVVVVGAVAFFGGMKYQQSQAVGPNNFRQFQGAGQGAGMMGRSFSGSQNRSFGNGQGRMGMGGSRPVAGEIISQDDKSITVKLPDGSSKLVILPDNVTISKTDTGSKTDLKSGVQVGVFGSENSDGSVTAQNIQLNPMFRFGTGARTTVSPSGSTR